MPKTTILILAAVMAAAGSVPAAAFVEPPVTSERDAACREVARSKVFTAPDPEGLGLYELGKRIYGTCMGQASAKTGITKASQSR